MKIPDDRKNALVIMHANLGTLCLTMECCGSRCTVVANQPNNDSKRVMWEAELTTLKVQAGFEETPFRCIFAEELRLNPETGKCVK